MELRRKLVHLYRRRGSGKCRNNHLREAAPGVPLAFSASALAIPHAYATEQLRYSGFQGFSGPSSAVYPKIIDRLTTNLRSPYGVALTSYAA
jgi:hypothetical protein